MRSFVSALPDAHLRLPEAKGRVFTMKPAPVDAPSRVDAVACSALERQRNFFRPLPVVSIEIGY
jgi:hypothetical protein